MTTKILLILIAAAVLISAAAFMLNRAPSPSSAASAVPTALFPELPAKVNDVATIEVRRPGSSCTITREGDHWVVASKGNYPARIEQVKSTVLALSQLKPVEAKTSNPELYSRIGVQDPAVAASPDAAGDQGTPPATPTLVTLKDPQGATLASLIVGTQKWGTTPSVFVRKVGEPQSWLAEAPGGGGGSLQIPADTMDWIDRRILNIPRDRIRSVSVVHPADGAEAEVSRENATDTGFTLANIPEGRELTAPTAPESLVTGIQYLDVDDVAPIDQVGFSSPDAVAVYRTFDGLVITVQSIKKDEKHWINVSFSFSGPQTGKSDAPDAAAAPDAQKEAGELAAKLSRWAFAIPEYKARTFTSRLDDFLKPPPASAETEPVPAGPAPEAEPHDGP